MLFGCSMLLGGITVFMLALRLISEYTDRLSGKKLNKLMSQITQNRFVACGVGALSTAIAQSSIATNIVAISFVNSGAISFMGACATVVGTNIGTTITAQLVSLKFSGGFDITVVGAFLALSGFLLSSVKNEKLSNVGNVALGFGLIFIGIELISSGIEAFKDYSWFKSIFLIKSAPILLLNGFFITAICQSSSVVSSMLVVLASKNLIGFTSCVYLLIGANVGTCIAVVVASSGKNLTSRRVAWFNVIFNVFGGVLFLTLNFVFGGWLSHVIKLSSASVTRQIANFHTFFNLFVGFVVIFLLKPFSRLVCVLIGDSSKNLSTNKRRIIVKK